MMIVTAVSMMVKRSVPMANLFRLVHVRVCVCVEVVGDRWRCGEGRSILMIVDHDEWSDRTKRSVSVRETCVNNGCEDRT